MNAKRRFVAAALPYVAQIRDEDRREYAFQCVVHQLFREPLEDEPGISYLAQQGIKRHVLRLALEAGLGK